MTSLPFALYDAFSDLAFGGSQAAIVSNAAGLSAQTRLKIARELGFPATCFVAGHDGNRISARFQSTVREYPMCGHGTICLMTLMLERGVLNWNGDDHISAELVLPAATAAVELHRRSDGRASVMLDIRPPEFRRDEPDRKILAGLLGIAVADFHLELPFETAIGDFVHLVIPVTGLDAMRRITPDFAALAHYCHEHGFETVAIFCLEVERPGAQIHVRDFCPAVGVAESAAAGTTNAALTAYLVHHNLVAETHEGKIIVVAEQGIEIERPSTLHSIVTMSNGAIDRLQVGGVATKVLEGELRLPSLEG